MTPAAFEKLRAHERHMREVLAATEIQRLPRRKHLAQRVWHEHALDKWLEGRTLRQIASDLHMTVEGVRQPLKALGIRTAGGSLIFGRVINEPAWRNCLHCGQTIPCHPSGSFYSARKFCSLRCHARYQGGFKAEAALKAYEVTRQFTDDEMIEALECHRHVKRAAAALGVTRGALVNRCGMLFIREFLGSKQENER